MKNKNKNKNKNENENKFVKDFLKKFQKYANRCSTGESPIPIDIDKAKKYIIKNIREINTNLEIICEPEQDLINIPTKYHLENSTNIYVNLTNFKSCKNGKVLAIAHYDHLCAEIDAENNKLLYPGVDDNGSGVACLLTLLSNYKKNIPSNLCVLFTTGEEYGFLGSTQAVQDHFGNTKKMKNVFVINVDMISRQVKNPPICVSSQSFESSKKGELISFLEKCEPEEKNQFEYKYMENWKKRTDLNPFYEHYSEDNDSVFLFDISSNYDNENSLEHYHTVNDKYYEELTNVTQIVYVSDFIENICKNFLLCANCPHCNGLGIF